MHRILLNFAGAINLSIGGLIFLAFLIFGNGIGSVIASIPFIIILATGGVFIYAANKSDLEKSFNKFVLISAILNIFVCNIISLILGVLGYSTLPKGEKSSEEVIKKKELTLEEKESRRLRNILGLGVGLIVLAGIIFATSTWETLSGSMKTIILILAAILFLLVSMLAEKRLKLKVSGMMYYALSNVLIIVSLISAGYFEVFGTWFSLQGNGSNLFITVIWLVIGFFSVLAYYKYKINNILYLSYLSSIFVLYFGILALGNFYGIAFFVISLIISFGAIYNLKDSIFKNFNCFCKLILPILVILLTVNIVRKDIGIVFNLMSFVILSIALYYLALAKNNDFFKIFAPIFTLINAIFICVVSDVVSQLLLLQITLIAGILYAVGYYKSEDKLFYNVSAVICNFAWLYVVIDAIDIGYYYLAVIASAVLLITSIIVSFNKNIHKIHFEKIVEPIKIFIFAYSVYMLFNSFEFMKNISFELVISAIFLIMYLVRKELFRFIYFIITCLFVFIMFVSSIGVFSLINSISVIAISIVLLITVMVSKDDKYSNFREALYLFILMSVFSLFSSLADEYKNFEIMCVIGALISCIVAYLLTSKNKVFRLITILAVFVPYYWALDSFADLYINGENFRFVRNIKYIFSSIPWIVMIIIYTRGFLKSISLNIVKVIEIVTLSIWYLAVLRRVAPEVGLVIGIVALISILVGYKSEKYVSFYYTGIVFTVINLLIQLKDLWSIIPIWAYILIAGLILIGIVTYKEYSKVSEKTSEVVPDIIEPDGFEIKKSEVDKRTVIVGSVIYLVILFVGFVNML